MFLKRFILPLTFLSYVCLSLAGLSSWAGPESVPEKKVDIKGQESFRQPIVPSLEIEEIQSLEKRWDSENTMEPLEAKAVVVDIVSHTLEYDTDKNLYTATGEVHVIVSDQGTELVADKVIYDPATELMEAEGNVVIDNKGERTYGTYAKIDLTRKSALINDPITSLDEIRVKAKQAFVDPDYIQLENGKLVIPPKGVVQKKQYTPEDFGEDDLASLAMNNPLLKDQQYENQVVSQELDMDWDKEGTGWRSKFRLHAKEVQVRRNEDGYDDINLVNPKFKFGKFTLARLHQMDLSHDTATGDIEYQGPDIGVDPDYGGLYFGPGWDFRLGKGTVRFSPIMSYGTGARRRRGGQEIEDTSGLGYGALLNYVSHDTKIRAGYNHKIGTPNLFMRKKLFAGKTRLIAAANEDYNQGFLGWERPKYIAQIADERNLVHNEHMLIKSFASLGVAHDEFFPTNDEDFFVETPDSEPITAGRVQLQTQIQNIKPLLKFGNDDRYVRVGASGQMALAGYTTGDFVGVMRAGPNVLLKWGDRFTSYNRYFYAATAGETPFVFDTYYRGRNSALSVNQYRINKYVTVGLRSRMSLSRDNSKGALFTGSSLFLLVGPEDVKLNLAYDFVRQRSFFGINYIPGNRRKTIHYDTMKIHQPINYGGRSNPAASTMMDNMGTVQDVGMMNGGKAR